MNYFYLASIIITVIAMCYVIYLARTWNRRISYKILYVPDSWSPPLSVVPGEYGCMGNFIHSPCCHACSIMNACQVHSPVRKFIAEAKDDKPFKNDEDCCAPVCAFGISAGNDFKPIRRQGDIQP